MVKINKKIHYFYRIDNLINGKFYYGIRTCSCLPGQDPYMGSGKLLHYAFRKYGIENFKKTVLRVLPTRQDALDLERWIVDLNMTKDPMCYNICMGGTGAVRYKMTVEKTKNEFPNAYQELLDGFNKLSDIAKNRTADKISTYGKKCVTKNGVNKYVKPSKLSKYLLNGWRLGRSRVNVPKLYRYPMIIHKFPEIDKFRDAALSMNPEINSWSLTNYEYQSPLPKLPKSQDKMESLARTKLNEIFNRIIKANYVMSDDSDEFIVNGIYVPLYEALGYKLIKRKIVYPKRLTSPTGGKTRIIDVLTLKCKFVDKNDLDSYLSSGNYKLYVDYLNEVNPKQPRLYRFHKGEEEVMIPAELRDQYYKMGFRKGKASREIPKRGKDKANCKGSRVMHKDGMNLMVAPDNIQEYLNNGWIMGNDRSLDNKYCHFTAKTAFQEASKP